MQDCGAGLAQHVLSLAPVAYPRRTAAARMALAHFGPHLWIIRPIARYLYTSCLGVPECARDISRCYRMQMHLVAGQADAIVDEIAAVDRTKGRLGVENVGRALLHCRVRK